METVTIPIEIWCDISEYSYDIWCDLRVLNRQFYTSVSAVNITGRFDYVHISVNGEYPEQMRKLFGRLFVVDTAKNEMVVFNKDKIAKLVRFEEIYADDSPYWMIKTMSRVHNYELNGKLHELSEFVGFTRDGWLTRCNRNLTVDDVDTLDDSYVPILANISHVDQVSRTSIRVPDGEYADFRVRHEFFLYNARSNVELIVNVN
jgi:hypothetical protein